MYFNGLTKLAQNRVAEIYFGTIKYPITRTAIIPGYEKQFDSYRTDELTF
jgi:hypothetical protein